MAESASPLPSAATVLVAGGSGSRAGLALPKQYAPYRGTTVLGFAVKRLRGAVSGPIIVVLPDGDEERAAGAIGSFKDVHFAIGGATRQESVRAGLGRLVKLTPSARHVLIHDAARPDLPPEVVARLLARLTDAKGAIPVLPVPDSMVFADDGLMGEPAPRDMLRRVQTPQAFVTQAIIAAHEAWQGAPNATDDAQVLRAAGMDVALVEGDEALRKLTYAEDFAIQAPSVRVGFGHDVHRLAEGEELWLCGIKIDHTHGLSGHSDADVAIHALVDALLGAIGAGDIGQHFPPSDPQWRGASSDRFLAHAATLVADAGYRLGNADVTITCEAPRIGPHREAMRAQLAGILGVDIGAVGVKATTTEKLGFTGRGEGIAAQAVVSLIRN
ncbi:MAG TPA: bifunctional 2-C-methyl-D-erythritol 4-phosphate cytidylyltransferase/2-C-methyl-D-erythritol 2,4-cyclodiphosphate synthase [Novosphingobium sp.]|nr:bifunctional 2-C-methyl-D-erythritol 4-phosphate cytidylyltransferase/2-C-methyl-D-erythritol 2,4-cyclodiphosphate synthase [Novosphingobium sp.]